MNDFCKCGSLGSVKINGIWYCSSCHQLPSDEELRKEWGQARQMIMIQQRKDVLWIEEYRKRNLPIRNAPSAYELKSKNVLDKINKYNEVIL